MTEPQVEAVMGRQADAAHHPWEVAFFIQPASDSSPEWEKLWLGSEWMIVVHFDSDGMVCQVICGDKGFDEPPPRSVSRLLWMLLGR